MFLVLFQFVDMWGQLYKKVKHLNNGFVTHSLVTVANHCNVLMY